MAQPVGKNRLRSALDLVASVAMVAASVAILWRVFAPARSGQPPKPTIPSAPIAVDEASLLGRVDAPYTLVEFSDFQCPYCRQFALSTFPQLKAELIDQGVLRMAFRHFPIEGLHPFAEAAAETAHCAGRQGAFWEAHDALFTLATLSEAAIDGALKGLPHLDPAIAAACRGDGVARRAIQSDISDALRFGINSTPTFFLGTTEADGSVRVVAVLSGVQSVENIRALVKEAQERKSGS